MDFEQVNQIVEKMVGLVNQAMAKALNSDKLAGTEGATRIEIKHIPDIHVPDRSHKLQVGIDTPFISCILEIWFYIPTADLSVFSYVTEKSLFEWHGVIEDTDLLMLLLDEAATQTLQNI